MIQRTFLFLLGDVRAYFIDDGASSTSPATHVYAARYPPRLEVLVGFRGCANEPGIRPQLLDLKYGYFVFIPSLAGDVNADNLIGIAVLICLVNILFKGWPLPTPCSVSEPGRSFRR